mmetsp:Transcript_10789/g.15028  ORF Transcript_10789/g.15028 Transcript_10789/m.15028 type:complete len:363 (+) Transcript_10789:16-1104(+)
MAAVGSVEEVSATHRVLKGHGFDIHLIGTAHISKESCEEVKELISSLQPRPLGVMVEICNQRWSMLYHQALKVRTLSECTQRILNGERAFDVVYGYLSSSVADKLGIVPGAEFFQARVEAEKIGAEVCLIDRPVSVTLGRAWGGLGAWTKIRFCFQAISEGLLDMDATELKDLIEEIRKTSKSDLFTDMLKQLSGKFPHLFHAIITERDLYLAIYARKYAELIRGRFLAAAGAAASKEETEGGDAKTRKGDESGGSSSISRSSSSSTSTFVCVVGAGHLDGMTENWRSVMRMSREDLNNEVKRLMHVPEVTWQSRALNFTLKWGTVTLLLTLTGAATYGTYLTGRYAIRKGRSAWNHYRASP